MSRTLGFLLFTATMVACREEGPVGDNAFTGQPAGDAVGDAEPEAAPDDVRPGGERVAKKPPEEAAPSGGNSGVRPQPGKPGGKPPATKKPQPTPAPGAHPAPPGQRPVGPKPPGINQVSATKWTVTRSLAERWMENPYALGNAREAGEGWQLVGVRAKAAYHLGMHNGDIILEANGHKLDTKPQLLAAYLDLKNDTRFQVTFLRNGQRMIHTYQILED